MLIEDLNVSISFLNDSKTFVGVLTTIVLMCVLIGDNNFIYEILKNTVDQIQKIHKTKTDNIIKNIKDIMDFDDLFKSSDYKLVLLCANGKTENSEKEKTDALKLVNYVQKRCQQFRFKYIKPVPPSLALDINNKPKDQEHFLAPLFCFFYSIILFIFDEILALKHLPYNNLFVIFSCLVLPV